MTPTLRHMLNAEVVHTSLGVVLFIVLDANRIPRSGRERVQFIIKRNSDVVEETIVGS